MAWSRRIRRWADGRAPSRCRAPRGPRRSPLPVASYAYVGYLGKNGINQPAIPGYQPFRFSAWESWDNNYTIAASGAIGPEERSFYITFTGSSVWYGLTLTQPKGDVPVLSCPVIMPYYRPWNQTYVSWPHFSSPANVVSFAVAPGQNPGGRNYWFRDGSVRYRTKPAEKRSDYSALSDLFRRLLHIPSNTGVGLVIVFDCLLGLSA